MAVLAVDCGGTLLRGARIEGDAYERIAVRERPTPGRADELPDAIAAVCAGLGEGRAVGIAIAGLVDHEGGDLVWMPHLGGGAPIAGPVSAATGLRVVVDNDANAACLAEATAGAGRGHRTVLTVTVGTGIGAGLVIDGKVERGRGFLGEVGHMTVDPHGPQCTCGLVGCWEVVASGRALDAAAQRLAAVDPDGAVARRAGDDPVAGVHLGLAATGDAGAAEAFDEVARRFGAGLASLVAVFDPDVIVVGGGVGSIGESFLDPARRAMTESTSLAAVRRATPLVPAHFGPKAGLVGAAILASAS